MVVGILFILLGAALLILTFKGYATSNISALLVGIYFLILGILLCITIYLENDRLTAFAVCGGIGILFLGLGMRNVLQLFTCTHKIEGTLCNVVPYTSKNVTLYSPVFQYTANGKKYQSQCSASYRKRYLKRRYSINGTYHIYINPKNPQVFIIKKRIGHTTWLLLCLGFLFLFELYYFWI